MSNNKSLVIIGALLVINLVTLCVIVGLGHKLRLKNRQCSLSESSDMIDHLAIIPLEILFKDSLPITLPNPKVEHRIWAKSSTNGPWLFFKVFAVPHVRRTDMNTLVLTVPQSVFASVYIDGALVMDSGKREKVLTDLKPGKHLIAVYVTPTETVEAGDEGFGCAIVKEERKKGGKKNKEVIVVTDSSWKYKRVST